MKYEEFEAERGKLYEKRLAAEGLLQDAQYTYGVVKERHDDLATQRAGAVTEQDRNALEPQVAESADKLRNASQLVRDREGNLADATNNLQEFEKGKNKAIAESVLEPALKVAHAVYTYHEVQHGAPNLEVMTHALAADVAIHALNETDALIANAEAKVTEFANNVGASPEHAERRNIEEEIAKHNDHFDEWDKLAKEFKQDVARQQAEDERDDIESEDRKKAIRGEFEAAAEKANQTFEKQNKAMSVLQEHAAQDPNVLTTQMQVRETMADEMGAKRYEVTRELCRPVAEINVDERNAGDLENSAGLNQSHLEAYGARVQGQPDAEVKVKTFGDRLDRDQQELAKTMAAERPQAVETEMTVLQRQHFPQIPAPAIETPALSQSGPPQQQM